MAFNLIRCRSVTRALPLITILALAHGMIVTGHAASAASRKDRIAPGVPQNVSATAVSTSAINLAWGAVTDTGGSGLKAYKVYRGGTLLKQVTAPALTTSDTGLTATTTYSYTVTAIDVAGNESAKSTVASATTLTPPDTTPPTLAISQPLSGQVFSVPGITVSGTASDAGGISTVTVNGAPATGTTVYSAAITLSAGENTITVVARDTAGNQTTATVTVTYTPPDTIAPGVPQNVNATAVSSSQINLNWSGVSDTGGSGLAGYRIYRASVFLKQVSASTLSTSDSGLGPQTAYSYFVSAIDNAGNESANSAVASATTLAPADTTPPTLTIAQPVSGQVLSVPGITVSGTASDAGGISTITVNGTPATGTTTYSAPITLSPGQNTITVVASDNSANQTTQSVTVTYTPPDTTAPGVPQNVSATAVSSSQINLSWSSVTDTGGSGLAGYRIYRTDTFLKAVDALTVSTSDTGLTPATVYVYSVSAIDNAGNESAKSVVASAATLALPDTTPPTLSITAPLDNQVCSVSSITVSGNASDAGGISSVTVNGAPATGTTSYSATVNLSVGQNTITVVARDSSGNETTRTVTVAYALPDTVAPEVPQGLRAVAVSPTQINLSWSSVTDSGGSGLAAYKIYRGGTFLKQVSAPAVSTPDSNLTAQTDYSYSVSAIDNAGNESARSAVASATTLPPPDTTPPQLAISQPSDQQQVSTSAIAVNGTATDAGGISKVTVNGLDAIGTTSFTAMVTLTSGANLITVVAYDLSGNQTSPKTSVFRF